MPLAQYYIIYSLQAVKANATYRNVSTFSLNELDSGFNNGTRDNAVYQYSSTGTVNGVEYSDVLERDLSGYGNVVALSEVFYTRKYTGNQLILVDLRRYLIEITGDKIRAVVAANRRPNR